jgi:hypothetical protein
MQERFAAATAGSAKGSELLSKEPKAGRLKGVCFRRHSDASMRPK